MLHFYFRVQVPLKYPCEILFWISREILKTSWIFIVLAHWNKSPRWDMSLHSDTLFWVRASQYLLFLLNAACLAEKQQIPILKSLVWPDWGSNPRSTALEASTLTIMPSMRLAGIEARTQFSTIECSIFMVLLFCNLEDN